MKIIIKKDDGTEEIFDRVSDAYLAVRQSQPMADREKRPGFEVLTKSYSWGPNLREIVKELHQSEIEIQKIINKDDHGNS